MLKCRKILCYSWLSFAFLMALFACDSANSSKLDANVPEESSAVDVSPIAIPAVIEIPSVIDPKDYSSATDDSKGQWGLPDCGINSVDLPTGTQTRGVLPTAPCPIQWPSKGEGLDYLVTSNSKLTQTFTIDLKIASLDKDAYLTIESPPGTLIAHVSAYDANSDADPSQFNPKPQSLLKSVTGVPVLYGTQTLRILFHGATKIEYIDVRKEFPTPTTVTWSKADLTNYTSFPDPLSEECIEYNGCTWAGWFAALDDQQTEGWVKAHNIIAIHSKHFSKYKLKTFRLRSGGKEIDAKVFDMCADSDCNGCCTKNSKKTGFLIDIESYSLNRFQVEDGVIEWRCLDCDLPSTTVPVVPTTP